MNLYPLKFTPILKPKIWGHESWQLSAYGGSISVVENGYLAGNDLNELVEVYMGELVGDHVFEHFGGLFPLLFKFIETNANLSVQVHPGDEVALERHGSLGKDEMWYVIRSKPHAQLILGLTEDIDREILSDRLRTKNFNSLLNKVEVAPGDVALIPHGLVHALRENVYVAEIQETSDLTYRLHDYDRIGADGKPRELHIEQAMEVMDYRRHTQAVVDYRPVMNGAANLAENEHFTTNLLCFDRKIGRDYAPLDSFVVYMCVGGAAEVETEEGSVLLSESETLLLPASIDEVFLTPRTKEVRLLEVYVP
ncbi:MAG: class I mannose-6-phosphate isomerase [Paludibacteraceae bacterium]|nr:class I mannose-6-phosphate isomerase [Paludibacteraceae bacterium]